MSLKNEMSINDYVSVIKRKLTIASVFFIIAFMIGIAYALFLPPVYESTGTILIESPQLQQGANAKVTYADDRFAALKQIVMTNDRLIGLAKKYRLFELDEYSTLDNDAVVALAEVMRKSIDIELLQADAGGWGQKTTFAFQISSQFNTAEDSYKIAQEIINSFLDQNAQKEDAKVSENASFYEKEAQLKKNDLETIEKQIESYKRTHAGALPQNMQIQVATMDRLQAALNTAQRDRSALEVELNTLQDSLEDAKLAPPDVVETADSNTELDRLNLELTKELGIYNDNHPSVKALKRKIEAIEAQQNTVSMPLETKRSKAQLANISKLERQIASTKSKIRSYGNEIADINARLSRAQSMVSQGAQTDGVLGTLERKYKDAIDEYSAAKAKYDSAQFDKTIQLEDKGERFVLVESPILPSSPIKPNRMFLIVLAFFASLGGAIGLPIVIEALDGRVRGIDNIASIMKLQPMASIPYIKNTGDELKVKYEFYNIVYIVFSVIVLGLIVVHFFVTPLDEFASQMYK